MATDPLDHLIEGAYFRLPYNPKENYGVARSLFRGHRGLNFGDASRLHVTRGG
jgi:hypothetical protein